MVKSDIYIFLFLACYKLLNVMSSCCHFSIYRSNGEVVHLRPKSEIEPVAKPKLDSEQLPARPKSVEVDSLVVKSSRESGKKAIRSSSGSSCLDCGVLQP